MPSVKAQRAIAAIEASQESLDAMVGAGNDTVLLAKAEVQATQALALAILAVEDSTLAIHDKLADIAREVPRIRGAITTGR